METLATMIARIYEITRRPELAALTTNAARTATLRAHHVDFFPRDKVAHRYTYTPSSSSRFYEVPDVSTVLTRNRGIKGLMGIDPAVNLPIEQFEYREVDDMYDEYRSLRYHAFNLIGDTLRFYPANATGAADIFYFQNPDLGTDTYNSWIANMYPEQVATWAAAIVLARTGFRQIAGDMQREEITPFKEQLIASHLLGNIN